MSPAMPSDGCNFTRNRKREWRIVEGESTTLREREVAQRFHLCDQAEMKPKSSSDTTSRTGGRCDFEEMTLAKK
jgi:hypothetical protein